MKLILKIHPVILFTLKGSEAAILTLNVYKNLPVVLKYHTGSHLGHVHLRGFNLHPMRGEH
jgi:hypothetical protein